MTTNGHANREPTRNPVLNFIVDSTQNKKGGYIVELPKTAMPIKGAIDHWVDTDGSVYCFDGRNRHKNQLIKKQQTTCQGYKYCGIRYQNGTISKRVHRLVAEAFIANPDCLPMVGHRNNRKDDNRVDNLYWTTASENTQKAYDDGLAKNDKGFNDSQSMPVKMYDSETNELLAEYGSIKDAAIETGICASTIARQARYKRPVRKPFYFRYADDVDCLKSPLIAACDYSSDRILATYYCVSQAANSTMESERTINWQLSHGKPRHKFSDTYFKYIDRQ